MKNILRRIFDSKNVALAIFLVIAASLAFNTFKVIQRNYELQQQVDRLADEVALIEIENQNLKYNIEYYKTDAYLELEARRRFNLAANGESVILLPKDGDLEISEEQPKEAVDQPQPQHEENFEKWMIFLFGSSN